MPSTKYIYVPEASLATPPSSGFYRVIKDAWWIAQGQNLVFYGSQQYPQCNHNESIARYLAKRLDPVCDVRQVPWVYIKINLQDYV